MDRFQTMRTFLHVVDEGGFTAAARKLGVDQALVTRQIADLENHLGIKLLERTTRKIRLTEAGDIFLVRCRKILAEVSEAEAEVSRSYQQMAGRVRLALPTAFSMEHAARRLSQLHEEFPDITVDVVMTDEPIDPVVDAFDVATTYADYEVSATAVARDLLEVPYVICATPDYLERNTQPETPADLAEHFCVSQIDPGVADSPMVRWTLQRANGVSESIDMRVALRTNTFALNLEAVRSGTGLARLPQTLVADDIAAGRLLPLLGEWNAGQLMFKVLYPGRKMIPRRVRYVIDTIFAQRDEANQAPG